MRLQKTSGAYAVLILLAVTSLGCSEPLPFPEIVLDSVDASSKLTLSCSEINRIPRKDQCDVQKQCSRSQDVSGYINYSKLYYCTNARPWAIVVAALSLSFCFVSLAHAASEYLCPNLHAISKLLQFSDNLSGLTLLAFGNGSADIFSTYHALESGSVELATSELICASLFILTVVVGSISIAKPFKVPKFFFFRDTFFYLLILTIMLLILTVGAINYIFATVLMVSYVVYVAFAVYTHSHLARLAHKLNNIAQVRNSYAWNPDVARGDAETEDLPSINNILEGYEDEEELIDDEFAEFLASHPHSALEERIPLGAGSYALKLLLKQLMKHSSKLVASKPSAVELSPPASSSEPTRPVEAPATRFGPSNYFDYFLSVVEKKHGLVLRLLLPDVYVGQPPLLLFYAVITAPANIVFKLTIPNRTMSMEHCAKLGSYDTFMTIFDPNRSEVTDDDYDYDVESTLFRVQIVLSAIMFSSKLYGFDYWLVLSIVIVGGAAALATQVPERSPEINVNIKKHHFWNNIGCFLGFCTSLVWISIFAAEIVTALKAAGTVFAITDDKVGATFFAFGNSIGDLVSNLSIARMGMPVMAFSACFGGPLLSICSLGLCSCIIMAKKKTTSIEIQFSNVLRITVFALIATLVFLGVFIPRNKWMFDRKVGYVLIGWWLLLMSLVLVL
ncbi:hypothetical protein METBISCDRAFT_26587 [Metschnikowia bicuspidata]|uniref:Sodium/calcium exchanger membrane region domain-containing protein n=1 Tax=Metschnikowia bicuspidata TaxID=27322 RepID=A0A4P9ZGX0_9ASCO|nr:hypothetical protein METBISCDRAFT_26587 [Metschnikowia bicuspidata]